MQNLLQMGQAFSSSLFEDIGFNFRYKIIRGFDNSISLITELKRGFKKQIFTTDVDENVILKIIEMLLLPL